MGDPSGPRAGRCADELRSRWAVVLDGSGTQGEQVGGKAAAVDRLLGAGFPVPASGAVTVDAYHRFVEQPDVRRLLDDLPDVDDIDDREAEAARIAEAFADIPIPDDVAEAIDDAVAALVGCNDGTALAARSSADVEDAAAASYAGQFESVLGCTSADEVCDAVRRVWASAFSPGVRSYRQAVGAEDEPAMAVLLMVMVEARHAGVVFTQDPGDPGRVRIETVEGPGEQLVSGKVTPERTVLDRDDLARGLDGSEPPFVRELAETALAVERELGGEAQDIEWVHDGERLWIVQSRPVTVAATSEGATSGDDETDEETDEAGDAAPDDGFDSPVAEHAHTPAGVREMLPGVLPPLVWTMAAPCLEEGFRSLFAALGALPDDDLAAGHRYVGRFRGRAALDLDLLRATARCMAGQSEAELERQYFGEFVSPDLQDAEGSGHEAGRAGVLPLLRAARLRRTQRRQAAIVNEATERVLAARPDLPTLSDAELLRYHHALGDLAARAIGTEVAVAGVAAAAYRMLERVLGRLRHEGSAELAQQLTSGAVRVCEASAFDVCELVDDLQHRPAIRDLLAGEEDDETVLDRLATVDGGSEVLEQIESVLDRAGSEQVFAGPRWVGRPEAALVTIRRALRSAGDEASPDPQGRFAELQDELTSTWRWRLTRVFTGQVVDVRMRLLRRTVADAIEWLRVREETKRTVLRIGGETRRLAEHVADRLVDEGALGSPDAIELFTHDEFVRVLEGGPPPDPDVLDRRSELLEQMRRLGPLPIRFDDRPGRAAAGATDDGRVLRGWGAGPGRHTGRPVVVSDQRSAELREGDVLVASSTDPSWTPLFVTASAVVVEEGGPLSHAAIVAREFGLPAVVNLAGATERLDGVARVTVDGGEGTVEILDDDGAPEAS